MESGTVLQIVRFCLEDGPGIRTTVFLKGCPMRCLWCHNPESWDRAPQIAVSQSRCIGCGACMRVCNNHRIEGTEHFFSEQNCSRCGDCVKVCPRGAISLVGSRKTAPEIIDEVERDHVFYTESGGGLTLSGGEPFFQPEFALSILREAKERALHTCVETCGLVPSDLLKRAAKLTDLFLFDVKETDATLHERFTGWSNEGILKNLFMLNKMGARFILRIPLIPGKNDSERNAKQIAELAKLQNAVGVEVLPYHKLGEEKAKRFGMKASFTAVVPNAKQIKDFREMILRD